MEERITTDINVAHTYIVAYINSDNHLLYTVTCSNPQDAIDDYNKLNNSNFDKEQFVIFEFVPDSKGVKCIKLLEDRKLEHQNNDKFFMVIRYNGIGNVLFTAVGRNVKKIIEHYNELNNTNYTENDFDINEHILIGDTFVYTFT